MNWTGFFERAFHRQHTLIKFAAVGGAASAINWLSCIIISKVISYEKSVVVSYLIGMAFSFALYKGSVFPNSTTNLKKQLVYFTIVNSAGLATVTLSSMLFSQLIAIYIDAAKAYNQASAHALAIALGAVVTFTGHRFLSFPTAQRELNSRQYYGEK